MIFGHHYYGRHGNYYKHLVIGKYKPYFVINSTYLIYILQKRSEINNVIFVSKYSCRKLK